MYPRYSNFQVDGVQIFGFSEIGNWELARNLDVPHAKRELLYYTQACRTLYKVQLRRLKKIAAKIIKPKRDKGTQRLDNSNI